MSYSDRFWIDGFLFSIILNLCKLTFYFILRISRIFRYLYLTTSYLFWFSGSRIDNLIILNLSKSKNFILSTPYWIVLIRAVRKQNFEKNRIVFFQNFGPKKSKNDFSNFFFFFQWRMREKAVEIWFFKGFFEIFFFGFFLFFRFK